MNGPRTEIDKPATAKFTRHPSSRERGFVLVAALLLLLLLSALSIGLLLMVNTETTAGGNDLQNNVAYHAAEGGIEKMTADLSAVFTNIQAPKADDIKAVSDQLPNIPGIVWKDYSVVPAEDSSGNLKTFWGTIQSGPNQGLNAQIIPVTLTVTAQAQLENQVSMVRTAEIALIPVFQFGVFSDSDLGFFNSPNMDFAGRVHTNGDLYLGVSSGYTLKFHDKLSAFGNVIRQRLPNGLKATDYGDTGYVYIPAAASGCDSGAACKKIGQTQGSVIDGPTSAQNSSWPTISKSTFNGWIIDGNYGKPGGTGATALTLPFAGGQAQPYEIIRRPPVGEVTTSPVSQARLMNKAEIRIFLSDDPADLPGGATDPQNIRLANVQTMAGAPDYSNGVPTSVPSSLPGLASGSVYRTYFAEASTAVEDSSQWSGSSTQPCLPPDWSILPKTFATLESGTYNWPLQNYMVKPTPASSDPTQPAFTSPFAGYAPYISANPGTDKTCMATQAQYNLELNYGSPVSPQPDQPPAQPNTWNLIDGYLRVEYRDVDGNYHPVTQEWLELGIARDVNPPTAPGGSTGGNDVNPNAILIFQEPADRNGDGVLDLTGGTQACSGSNPHKTCGIPKPPELATDPNSSSAFFGDGAQTSSVTRNNWYPINFYDAREGEVRDKVYSDGSCTANGVMNAVELDVGNLKKWLASTTGHGPDVDADTDNGYILYYSDRRGMLGNPNAEYAKTGDSGLEDDINASSSAGTPDGTLETPGGSASPEDVNENTHLDNFGPWDLGLGFGTDQAGHVLYSDIIANSSQPNPYVRFSNCLSTGRANWVSGARHVLVLVDGALGQVPTKPNGDGGFTVASENPVYIMGNYNSNSSDPSWSNPSASVTHSAAAIIADSVTLLSNKWNDQISLKYPTGATNHRDASTTYYRVAIAAGKNKTFPAPSYTQTSTLYGYGTDGGVHNFLRFLEDWTNVNAYYKGSLVSLFYSTYNTGVFKCCGDAVYHPPTRNFSFDPLFSQPQNLPPGTPMFRDVDNLSYRQDFSHRTD